MGPSGVEGNYCSPRGLSLQQPPTLSEAALSLPQQLQQGSYYAESCRESKCAVMRMLVGPDWAHRYIEDVLFLIEEGISWLSLTNEVNRELSQPSFFSLSLALYVATVAFHHLSRSFIIIKHWRIQVLQESSFCITSLILTLWAETSHSFSLFCLENVESLK